MYIQKKEHQQTKKFLLKKLTNYIQKVTKISIQKKEKTITS
jgi:hypothetical protein